MTRKDFIFQACIHRLSTGQYIGAAIGKTNDIVSEAVELANILEKRGYHFEKEQPETNELRTADVPSLSGSTVTLVLGDLRKKLISDATPASPILAFLCVPLVADWLPELHDMAYKDYFDEVTIGTNGRSIEVVLNTNPNQGLTKQEKTFSNVGEDKRLLLLSENEGAILVLSSDEFQKLYCAGKIMFTEAPLW